MTLSVVGGVLATTGTASTFPRGSDSEVGAIEGMPIDAMRTQRFAQFATFGLGIGGVVLGCAFKEVILSYARPVITAMQDQKRAFPVNEAMSQDASSCGRQTEDSVAVMSLGRSPLPAIAKMGHMRGNRAVFVDVSPEPRLNIHRFGAGQGTMRKHLNVLSGVTEPDVDASRLPSILLDQVRR